MALTPSNPNSLTAREKLPEHIRDAFYGRDISKKPVSIEEPKKVSDSLPKAPSSDQYTVMEWQGAPGRTGLPQTKGNGAINGRGQVMMPVSDAKDFLASGYGGNFRAAGLGSAGMGIPEVYSAKRTDPLTGQVDPYLFMKGDEWNKGNSHISWDGHKVDMDDPMNDPMNYIWDFPKFAKGGLVKVARELQDKGRFDDTILAHISPEEARLLKSMGGAGTINPDTGLPEYFSWKKIVGALAPLVGNMVAPGIGGIIGGALGGAVSGGGIEGALAGGLGSGLGHYGGQFLNSIGVGSGGGLGSGLAGMFGGGRQQQTQAQPRVVDESAGLPWLAGNNDPDRPWLSQGGSQKKGVSPLVQLGLGLGALSALSSKSNSDDKLNDDRRKRDEEDERQAREFRDVIESQPSRQVKDYYGYGERPDYSYFTDYGPIKQFAKGGHVSGPGGGQDDQIPAYLSNNEYVVPADIVSNLGDGAPEVGAKKLDGMVKNVRKHKAKKGHPPKAKKAEKYLRGGLT